MRMSNCWLQSGEGAKRTTPIASIDRYCDLRFGCVHGLGRRTIVRCFHPKFQPVALPDRRDIVVKRRVIKAPTRGGVPMSASAKDRDILDRRDFMTGSIVAAGAAAIVIGEAATATAQQNSGKGARGPGPSIRAKRFRRKRLSAGLMLRISSPGKNISSIFKVCRRRAASIGTCRSSWPRALDPASVSL